MSQTDPGAKLKVFFAYSRKDAEFVDKLAAGLSAAGIYPYFDRQDIAVGESWRDRLSSLIAASDTIIFVISPESVRSNVALWEIEKAEALGKRLIPVVRQLPEGDLPSRLAQMNWVSFVEPDSFDSALETLVRALNTDIGWLREHTRLTEIALRWDSRGRSEDLLLRGEDIRSVTEWMAKRPRTAPEILPLQLQFIEASIAAADNQAAKAAEFGATLARLQAMIAEQTQKEKERNERLARLEQLENELRESKAELQRYKNLQRRNRRGIFISYRREDSGPWAGRVFDRLRLDFRRADLFMDVDSIQRGRNFNDVLHEHLEKCAVMLAVIGKNWLGERSDGGGRRLDDPKDIVRLEIGTALTRGLAVIPLLIEGARLPKPEDNLPDELRSLSYQQASTITHESFERDIEVTIKDIRGYIRKGSRWPLAAAVAAAVAGLIVVGWQLGVWR